MYGLGTYVHIKGQVGVHEASARRVELSLTTGYILLITCTWQMHVLYHRALSPCPTHYTLAPHEIHHKPAQARHGYIIAYMQDVPYLRWQMIVANVGVKNRQCRLIQGALAVTLLHLPPAPSQG